MTDESKLELGTISAFALQGLDTTIWRRSLATMEAAESDYDGGTLTAELALRYLTALLEQRKLVNTLRNQVEEGLRARSRVAKSYEQQATVLAREEAQRLHGRNRFARSRVNRPAAE